LIRSSGRLLWVAGIVCGMAPSVATAQDAVGQSSTGAEAQTKEGHKGMKTLIYIGTYTNSGSKGIYLCRMDCGVGKLELAGPVAEEKNPSFLAIHPSRRYLYSVSEVDRHEGKRTGSVSAYAIDAKTGVLTFLNRPISHGMLPCYLSVDAAGKYLLTANYTSGTVTMFPIESDGRLREASDVVQHVGKGPNASRQEGPHAHSILIDAANRFAFSPDLGIDKVMIYRLDLERGKLVPNDPPSASVPPGAGPRHFAFHPNGKFAYVINEMGCSMTAFAYDAAKGSLAAIETVPTLPTDWKGVSHCADVHVHPSGKFVYGSNRGHDSIVIFAIDPATGKLTLRGFESTRGKTPRNFAIDPTGAFLLAANQDSDNIVVFRIDTETGLLSAAGCEVKVPKPVCIAFMPTGR